MKVTRILMIVFLVGLCVLMPSSLTHFRDYFDATLREVNSGHYDYHPASLLWSGMNLILFIAVLISIIGNKTATRIAMITLLYTPIYVLYGNYGVTPRGFHTTSLNLLIILVTAVAIEILLMKHLKNITEPQHAP